MYEVAIRRRAEKDIADLPASVARRVAEAIAALKSDPRPPGTRKLEADAGYRIRVGDYRIVYEIDDDVRRVIIVRVRHRRDVYRTLS